MSTTYHLLDSKVYRAAPKKHSCGYLYMMDSVSIHPDSPRLIQTHPDSARTQPGLSRTQPDSTRFSQTQPDSARLNQIQPDSTRISWIRPELTRFSRYKINSEVFDKVVIHHFFKPNFFQGACKRLRGGFTFQTIVQVIRRKVCQAFTPSRYLGVECH